MTEKEIQNILSDSKVSCSCCEKTIDFVEGRHYALKQEPHCYGCWNTKKEEEEIERLIRG